MTGKKVSGAQPWAGDHPSNSGELLRDMAERGERDNSKGGDRRSQSHDATLKLADVGLTKDESARFQQIAR